MKSDIKGIADEIERFQREVVEADSESIDILLERYCSFRRTLAKRFQKVAEARLLRGDTAIEAIRQRIERAMRDSFRGTLPSNYLTIRPYAGVHSVLLEYLARHLAQPVPASHLRVLTADQIHTERRVRELRDLGLNVSWKKVSDEDQYVLASLDLELATAAKCHLERMIRADRSRNETEKRRFREIVQTGIERIPPDAGKYTAP